MSWAPCDLYGVLGVGQEASGEEIKTAYRRAALQHHPDKGGSVETFKLVAHAFETLFCPNSRARYDRRRAGVRTATGGRGAATGAPGAGEAAAPAKGARKAAAAAAGAGVRPPAGVGSGPAGKSAGEDGCCSGVGRDERRAAVGARRLECIIRRLCALLAAVSKEDRRAALDGASGRLRARLLAFMEARQSGKAGTPAGARARPCDASVGGGAARGKAELPCVGEDPSDDEPLLALEMQAATGGHVSGASPVGDLGEARSVACSGPDLLAPAAAELPTATRVRGFAAGGTQEPTDGSSQRKNVRFPGIYMRTGWRQDFYVAAAGLENFTIFSRNVRSLEEAVNYHIALLQVKRALEANSQVAGPRRPFRERLAAALREAPPLEGLQPSFYTVLTCARSFGAKKIRSPATVDLQEALDHHQRLTEARHLGHAALRAAWAEVLQVERTRKAGARGNAIKRPRTPEEAEEFVAGAERAAKAWRDARNLRAAARREALARADSSSGGHDARRARQLARLRRLLALAELLVARERRRELWALAKQRAAARRAALQERARRRLARRLAARRSHEELRARERQWRARRAWLRSCRSRTFAEEQRGPPAA